jgi:hypothetical protein
MSHLKEVPMRALIKILGKIGAALVSPERSHAIWRFPPFVAPTRMAQWAADARQRESEDLR